MRRLILFIVLFSLISCTKEYQAERAVPSNTITKAVGSMDAGRTFVFDSITNPSNWCKYESFDEMVDACQIPDSLLSSISVEELYALCLEYPLGPSCFFFNDHVFGFDRMLERFNGYALLQSRLKSNEGLKIKLGAYAQAAEAAQAANIKAETETLTAEYKKLLDGKLFNPRITASVLNTVSSGYPITVRTPYGKAVDAIYGMGGMTEVEYSDMLSYMQSKFPNAEIIGEPTIDYNCHGYAWCMVSGGPTCWINCGTSAMDVSNISKYWNNDAYSLTTSEATATRIHYYNDDHSAVKSSVSGYYESKWGEMFLVRHKPTYCPYGSDRHYYTGSHYVIQCIQGQGMIVPLGEQRGYYLNPYPIGPDVSWTWDVESDKTGESVAGTFATITPNSSAGYPSVNIIFSKAGSYDVICRFCNSFREESWRYQVYVDPI